MLLLLSFSCAAHKEIVYQQTDPSNQRNIIVQSAIESLGMPYKWGGRSPKTGFDCSGLIVYTHQKADIILPRTAQAQFDNGKPVSKQNLQVADLVFFKTPKENKIFHVGIYVGDERFIHAPGKGRKVTYGYLSNPYFKRYYIGSRRFL